MYKYFDANHAGWRGVATTDIFTVSLIVLVFFAQRGLQTTRENLAGKVRHAL